MPAVAVLAGGNIIRVIDFTGQADGDAVSWLEKQGFEFELNAKKLNPRFENDALVLSTGDKTAGLFGLRFAQQDFIHGVKRVEIVWGVNKFPAGASYQKGRRNEAIMFYAFFGKEMVDSGSAIIPDSPYFIALHLCENDPVGVPLMGRYYHKGGRFICAAHPKPGEVVTTRLDLKKTFKDIFGFQAPALSGIAFEFDTTKPQDDGTSSGFVQSLKFPKATYIRED